MKLKVIYTLNISSEYAPLIPVIASMEGWTPEDGRTAEQYINDVISKPRVALTFQTVVFNAIEKYFGVIGKAQLEAVKAKYLDQFSVTSEFVQDEESEPV